MKAILTYTAADRTEVTAVIPDSAITPSREPFFVPDSRKWSAIPAVGVRIDRLGKGIDGRFADRYYSECFTAVHPFADGDRDADIASRWAIDGALVISPTVPADGIDPAVRAALERLIARTSLLSTLKTGDLIMVGDYDRAFSLGPPPSDHPVKGPEGFPEMKLKVR